MKANERQVGGDHYKTGGAELWDLFGPEALVFYALRYVSRWRKKNGVEDLQKARHIVEKMIEVAPQYKNYGRLRMAVSDDLVDAWIRNSGMDFVERTIAGHLIYMLSEDNLREAMAGIDHLIEGAPASLHRNLNREAILKESLVVKYDDKED